MKSTCRANNDTQSYYAASLSTLSAMLNFSDRQNVVPVEPYLQIIPPSEDVDTFIQHVLHLRPQFRAMQDEVSAVTKFSKAEHELWRPAVAASGVDLAPRLFHLSRAD